MSIGTWFQEKIREAGPAFYKELASSLAKGLIILLGLASSFALPWVRSSLLVPVTLSRVTWILTAIVGALFGACLLFILLRPKIRELMEIAATDDLTKVYNSRELQRRLTVEMERAKRYGRPLALILIDIDGFKAINDKHGYGAGDMVLREFAQIVKERVRGTDVVCRYKHGDEFAVIAVETTAEEARTPAERLRSTVEIYTFPVPRNPKKVTISVGVVGFDPAKDTVDALQKRAETELAKAKKKKNYVATERI